MSIFSIFSNFWKDIECLESHMVCLVCANHVKVKKMESPDLKEFFLFGTFFLWSYYSALYFDLKIQNFHQKRPFLGFYRELRCKKGIFGVFLPYPKKNVRIIEYSWNNTIIFMLVIRNAHMFW